MQTPHRSTEIARPANTNCVFELGYEHEDRTMKHHQQLLAAVLLVATQLSASAQMPIPIQNYDAEVFQRTIDKVYDTWERSKYSNRLEIDTILCAYILTFDTLDLVRIAMDENILKKNLRLSQNADGFYNCRCVVYDHAGEDLAALEAWGFYGVYPKSPYKTWDEEHLRERILDHKEILFIPQSRIHAFSGKWRMIATGSGDLRWLYFDDPDQTYSSSEVFHEHLEKFILRTTQPDSVSVINKPGFLRIRWRRQ